MLLATVYYACDDAVNCYLGLYDTVRYPTDIIIYYENRTQGTLKTIQKKKCNRLKSNSRYIFH